MHQRRRTRQRPTPGAIDRAVVVYPQGTDLLALMRGKQPARGRITPS
jgi:hypothetical protein